MEIRILDENDAADYWHLRLEALQTEPFAFGKSAEEHQATSVQEWAGRFRETRPNYFNLGAVDGGKIVGIITFMRASGLKEQHKGNIYGFYVTASHRRKGVGHALVRALLDRVRENVSVEQILLGVGSLQKDARELYRKFGFEPFGEEPRSLKVGSAYINETHMILRLR